MTWKTSVDCSICGASYELTAWDLGHQDSDSISCECCGSVLREWRKESRSYSITDVIRKGSLKLSDDDLPAYIGKWIRIEKGSEVFEGKVKGLADSVVSTSSATVARPWLLETASSDIHFIPSSGWRICYAKPKA